MSRRHSGTRRTVLCRVPTEDGHQVEVRNRTVARRLLDQEHRLEALETRAVMLAREKRELRQHLEGQRLVRLLVRLGWISIAPKPRAPITARLAPAPAGQQSPAPRSEGGAA